jgi:hypothetical protein
MGDILIIIFFHSHFTGTMWVKVPTLVEVSHLGLFCHGYIIEKGVFSCTFLYSLGH